MNNRLSHSSANTYQECPTKWKLHYQEKLRGQTTNAALLFGSALDAAIGKLLVDPKLNPLQTFHDHWEYAFINNKRVYIPDTDLVVYAESDLDVELIQPNQIKQIEKVFPDCLQNLSRVQAEKKEKGFDNLSKEDKKLYNLVNWFCLAEKARFMIEAFQKHILPNIEQVLATQLQVDLDNGKGDSILGFADFVVKYKGYDKPVILDLKTSTRQYETDAVLTSPQLALYVHGLSDKFDNTDLAGFVVLHKTIKKNRSKVCSKCEFDGSGGRHKTCSNEIDGKRCTGEWIEKIKPEATFQLLINKIPSRIQDMVVENYDIMNEAIKTGHFYKNLSSCIKPYGRCIYYDLCHKGKDDSLIKVEK